MWFAYRAIWAATPYDMARSRVNAQCDLSDFLIANICTLIYSRSGPACSYHLRKTQTPSDASFSMTVFPWH